MHFCTMTGGYLRHFAGEIAKELIAVSLVKCRSIFMPEFGMMGEEFSLAFLRRQDYNNKIPDVV